MNVLFQQLVTITSCACTPGADDIANKLPGKYCGLAVSEATSALVALDSFAFLLDGGQSLLLTAALACQWCCRNTVSVRSDGFSNNVVLS